MDKISQVKDAVYLLKVMVEAERLDTKDLKDRVDNLSDQIKLLREMLKKRK